MIREAWDNVAAIAVAMAGEIESVVVVGAPFDGDLLTDMTRDVDAQAALQFTLSRMFALIEARELFATLPGHQEPELEAAGLVQSAFKWIVCNVFPELRPVFDDYAVLTKFARLPHPVRQAPRDVWVPSMRDQLAGRQPVPPPSGSPRVAEGGGR